VGRSAFRSRKRCSNKGDNRERTFVMIILNPPFSIPIKFSTGTLTSCSLEKGEHRSLVASVPRCRSLTSKVTNVVPAHHWPLINIFLHVTPSAC
jgi:hypothetical protein